MPSRDTSRGSLMAGAELWARRRPCGYDTTYGHLSIALTGSATSARVLGTIANELHVRGIDGMLTKAGGQVDWNAANDETLTCEYQAARVARRDTEGLTLPHGTERTLTPEQVKAVLADDPNLWRQYVEPRCDHLVLTKPR